MLQVAVAVIIRNNKILLAKRAMHKVQGGAWEFPGGKIEPNEKSFDALVRECAEELAITVIKANKIITTNHAYPEFKVKLEAFLIQNYIGEPIGAENQVIKWVDLDEMRQYLFIAADWAILNAAVLPNRYLITPDISPNLIIKHIQNAINDGFTLMQLRTPSLANDDYLQLVKDIYNQFTEKTQLMVKGDTDILNKFPKAGLHLTSLQLNDFNARPIKRGKLLAASIHNLTELKKAQKLEVDFVTLSPIKLTLSHPKAQILAEEDVNQIMSCAQIPVFWQGGMQIEDMQNALKNGAQGISAIRGFMKD